MDFSPRFNTIAPVPFSALLGGKQDQEQAPQAGEGRRAFISRIHKRRFACLARAEEAVDYLPEEGEALHTKMTGYFDLMHLLIVLLNRFACPVRSMHISTLSLSARNVSELVALHDQGRVRKIDLLAAHYFMKIESEIFNHLLAEFRARGLRVGIDRDHSKIVCILLEDGRRYVIETSANLRTNRNKEFLTLVRDDALYAFRSREIEEAVTRHAV